MSNCACTEHKFGVRNFVTIATVATFLLIVGNIIFIDTEMTENPVLMFILGSFMTAVTMIYTFYYRKNPSKRKRQKFNDNFEDDDDLCPCCGQELKSLKD